MRPQGQIRGATSISKLKLQTHHQKWKKIPGPSSLRNRRMDMGQRQEEKREDYQSIGNLKLLFLASLES
jgi:hypothetical protein